MNRFKMNKYKMKRFKMNKSKMNKNIIRILKRILKKKTLVMKELIKLVNLIIIYFHLKGFYLNKNLIRMKMIIKNKN